MKKYLYISLPQPVLLPVFFVQNPMDNHMIFEIFSFSSLIVILPLLKVNAEHDNNCRFQKAVSGLFVVLAVD